MLRNMVAPDRFDEAAVHVARLDLNHQEAVPPKRNYDFEKRRKEQDRKAKKDLKRAEREQRRNERRVDDAPAPENTDSSPET